MEEEPEQNTALAGKYRKVFGLSQPDSDKSTSELSLFAGTINNITEDENLLNIALDVLGENVPPYEDFLELSQPSSKVRKALSEISILQHEQMQLANIIPEDAVTVEAIQYELNYYKNEKASGRYLEAGTPEHDLVANLGFCPFERDLLTYLEQAKEHEQTCRKIIEIDKKIAQKRADVRHVPYASKVVEFVSKTLPEHTQANEKSYQEYLQTHHTETLESVNALSVPVNIPEEATQRHTYITGASGSGKSELLKVLTYAHYQNGAKSRGSSCVVIDPHGDLVAEMMRHEAYCNDEGKQRILYLAPHLFPDKSFVINPLQAPKNSTDHDREVMAQEVCSAFEELLGGGVGGSLSLNMRALLLPCLKVLIDEDNTTLLDLKHMLREHDKEHGKYTALGRASHRPFEADFFEHEFLGADYKGTKAAILTKLNSLLGNTRFYNATVGKSTVDLTKEMDSKKLVFFNLSKGELGDDATEAIGRFVVAQLTCMALKRQTQDKDKRVPVHVLIDECQNFIGKSTETILAEARKYGLHLTLAQQIVGQKMTDELKKIVLGNTDIKIIGKTREDRTAANLMEKDITALQDLNVGRF